MIAEKGKTMGGNWLDKAEALNIENIGEFATFETPTPTISFRFVMIVIEKSDARVVKAPNSNWRFSGLLKICARINFSDIFEEHCQKSPTAGSCKTLGATNERNPSINHIHFNS